MKKNLIVILLIPFMIALLGVVAMNQTYNLVDADIVSIDWDYNEVEGFKLQDDLRYILHAKGVNQRNQEAQNNKLKWSVVNKNPDEDNHAEIKEANGMIYLKTLSEGEVIITCSNEKGNIMRSMNAVIYVNGAVLISSFIKASGNNIDPYIYIGDTDLNGGIEMDASFALNVVTMPSEMISSLEIIDQTNNFEYDLSTNTIKINKDIIVDELASLTLGFRDNDNIISYQYDFKIVRDGINIYNYEDLQYVSENNKIGVLRKSFESVDNAYVKNNNGDVLLVNNEPTLVSNNVECFGLYNTKTKKVSFSKDQLYHFTTTYNSKFIQFWNDKMKELKSTNYISDQIYVALRITNDFYGNGYTLNFHNLTYPTGGTEVTLENGATIFVPTLDPSDIYRGPLPFYTLGDHNNMPLIEALGQDNIGLYVDGDDILVNDVIVKNCDFGNFYDTLNTVGTVLEVNGDNVIIKNSRLSNGKNVLRTFSNMNLTITNSMLSYAKGFLILSGSNEYVDINVRQIHNLYDVDGNRIYIELGDYLSISAEGDKIMNQFLEGSYTNKDSMKTKLVALQKALNNDDTIPDEYVGTTTINNTIFYNASVAAIGFDTLFNGPYLFSGSPSTISSLLGMLSTNDGVPLSELLATNVSGISYRTNIEITGNCKFYNYQTIDKDHSTVDGLDISGLINENITAMAASLGEQYAVEVNIDKFFPIKDYLFDIASPNKETHRYSGKSYINVICAWYGGGVNGSTISFPDESDILDNKDKLYYNVGPVRKIDLMDTYLNLPQGSGMIAMYKNMMLKAVTVVAGIEPFKFIMMKNGYDFGEKPDVLLLRENARNE